MIKWIAGAALVAAAATAHAQYSLQRFDINTQPGWAQGSNPSGFTSFKGKTYFFASDGVNGRKIWRSDGTSVTMENVKGYLSLSYNNTNPEMKVAGNYLFYAANDPQYGTELFKFDGVHSEMAMDMMTGSAAGSPNGSNPRHFATINNRLYFHGGTWGLFGIWVYDPVTTIISRLVDYKDIGGASFSTGLFPFGDKLVFTADDSLAWTEPYEANGKTGSFRRIDDINPGAANSYAQGFTEYANQLFFIAASDKGYELYRYDGAGAPTRLTDIAPGPANSFGSTHFGGVTGFGGLGSKVYFAAKDTSGIFDLYSYDILSKQVKMEYALNSYSPASAFVEYNGKLFFALGYSLMVMDGNSPPVDLATLGLGLPISTPENLTVSNGRLFFSATNQSGDRELYVLTDSAVVNVEELTIENGATIYPNPATSEATINFTLKQNTKLSIVLSDMQGRVVMRLTEQCSAGRNEVVVPLSEFAPGIYIFTVRDEGGLAIGRGTITKQ